ncbi:hypothetical protein DFH09DRAFT_1200487 [Mycena vulgaris]|nr:hypothetical protein DFH09DRAFT_1200487 [Mycena vulgaris]
MPSTSLAFNLSFVTISNAAISAVIKERASVNPLDRNVDTWNGHKILAGPATARTHLPPAKGIIEVARHRRNIPEIEINFSFPINEIGYWLQMRIGITLNGSGCRISDGSAPELLPRVSPGFFCNARSHSQLKAPYVLSG